MQTIKKFQIKAFTLMESLLVLAISSFVVLSFSFSMTSIISRVEEQLFFLSFEHLYRDSQTLSVLSGESIRLELSKNEVSNGKMTLHLPKNVQLQQDYLIIFEHGGGNSSLQKIVFETATKKVQYQLYIGSGKYKKTEIISLSTLRKFNCAQFICQHHNAYLGAG